MYSFLWGYLKKHVHGAPPRTMEEIVVRLLAAFTTGDASMLRRVPVDAWVRTKVFLKMNGGLLEHLL
jgi:hypothetical protein